MKGSIFVFLSAILFGSYGIWAVLLGSDFGVFFLGYVRALLVLMVLVPIMLITRSWQPLTSSDIRAYSWCCGFAIFTQAPVYFAFQNAGVGIVSLIFFASSLVTAYIVGALLLQETITRIKLYSLLLGIFGLMMIFWNSMGAFSAFALVLAALNGLASGGEVSTTKLVPLRFSAIQTSVLVWGAIFVTHLPVSLIVGETQLMPTLNAHWFAMFAFAFAGVAAFWLVIEGYKTVDASIGGLIGLLEIVCAILFGVVVFSEKITATIIVGSLVILSAAVLPYVYDLYIKREALT